MTKAELVSDLRELIDDLPVVFNIGGTDYTGTSSQVASTKTLEEGGFLQEFDKVLVAVIDDFPNSVIPDNGTRVTIAGRDYRIEKTTPDDLLAGVEFGLMTVNK